MRVVNCVGARPQFVKASVLSTELRRRGVNEILVHTGQHYDRRMSEIFFAELPLPKPKYELGVGSAGHGAQTAEMLRRLEPILLAEAPDWILVYGDTNTTLAGALAASKLGVRIAHVEAGMRSFNRNMPEEINRIVTDHVSDLLFVPSRRVANQLAGEGITDGVRVVGDLMVDLAAGVAATVPAHPAVLEHFGVQPYAYAVATIHRASNADDPATFARLIAGLRRLDMPVVFPVHPRSCEPALACGIGRGDNIVVSPPLSYADMIALAGRARVVLTDSGGVQKEAYVLKVPCVTLREETEWLETLEDEWNVLAGSDPDRIEAAALRAVPVRQRALFGGGTAAREIADALSAGTREQGAEDVLETMA